jgi:hypothetical protein
MSRWPRRSPITPICPDQKDAIPFLLHKLAHEAFIFASSQRLDAALEQEGLQVVDQTTLNT